MSGSGTPSTRGASGRGAHSRHERLAKGLGLFSIGLGLAELLGARTLCRGLGMKGHEGLVRAYGAREVATGIAILASHDPTPWIWGRVGGDILDLATLATGLEAGNPKRDNVALAAVLVAGVTAIDVVCVQGLSVDKRLAPPGTTERPARSGFPRSPQAMRGAASDFAVPADFRIPEALRPWDAGRSGTPSPATTQPGQRP